MLNAFRHTVSKGLGLKQDGNFKNCINTCRPYSLNTNFLVLHEKLRNSSGIASATKIVL